MSSRWVMTASTAWLLACAEPAGPAPAAPVAPVAAQAASPAPVAARPAPDGPAWLTRGNWQLEWSAYVRRETTLGGGPITVWSPAPGAHRVLRDTDATPAKVDSAAGSLTLSKGASASLFDATTLPLARGEIIERDVPGDVVTAMAITGDHARAYWTKPHQRTRHEKGATAHETFSTLFVEGVSAGTCTLTLRAADGTTREIPVAVSAGSR